MKKGLIASLIIYGLLLVAVVTMMVTYVILKNSDYVGNLQHLFKAVKYVFIAFAVAFVAVIVLLILYPRVLQKLYFDNIKSFVDEHISKYPEQTGKALVTVKEKNVYVSFIMSETDIDTYCFELKEKPLTKKEPVRIAYNVLNLLLVQNQ